MSPEGAHVHELMRKLGEAKLALTRASAAKQHLLAHAEAAKQPPRELRKLRSSLRFKRSFAKQSCAGEQSRRLCERVNLAVSEIYALLY